MERLDLRLVEYFLVVAEELHFSRAAAKLHIAQPSLSQQIRRLEQQLGVKLLDRTSRHVELTPAGHALMLEGGRVMQHADRVIQTVRAAGSEQLTIGFYGSAATTLLPEVLTTFSERHPLVHVSLRELLLGSVDDILDGEVDIAFTRLLPDQANVEIEIIARERRLVALPSDHPLAERNSVSFADLRMDSFITNPAVPAAGPPARWLLEQRARGLPGKVAAQAGSIQEILTLVASRRGICLVPASVASEHRRGDVAYVEVEDADPALVSLAWRRDDTSPTRAAFVDVARETAAR